MSRAAGPQAPSAKNAHGQYFTPGNIANLMVSMLVSAPDTAALEPSAGQGVFVEALLDAGFSDVQAVEIDASLLTTSRAPVDHESFVSWQPDYRCGIAIGNPPYIRWKNLGEDQKDELRASPYWGTLINSLSDYLNVFIIKTIQHLRTGGELVFITPAFWMHTQHASLLRDFMLTQGVITDLVTFGESTVFPGVSSSVMIFRYVKTTDVPKTIRHYKYIGARTVGTGPLKLDDSQRFELGEIPQFQRGSHWTLAAKGVHIHLAQHEMWTMGASSEPRTIGGYCDIANGMVIGLDRAFRLPLEMLPLLTKRETAAVTHVSKAANLDVLFSGTTTPYIDIPPGLTESKVRDRYPHLIAHLEIHRDALDRRYSMKGVLPFWEWSFRRSEKMHKDARRKLFVPCKERLTNRTHPRFCFVPAGSVPTQDVTSVAPMPTTREAVEYIAAFLTLDEVAEWIRYRGLMKGGVAEFSERPLAAIPFRPVNWDDPCEVTTHSEIVKVVRAVEAGTTPTDAALRDIHCLFERLGLTTTRQAS